MDKRELLGMVRRAALAAGAICLAAAVVLLFRMFINERSLNGDIIEEPIEVSHRVLFISSYNSTYFTYPSQERGLEAGLYPNGIEYDAVFMDAKNYKTEADKLAFYEFLSSRLKEKDKYEAVLLGDDDALKFALEYQNELFSGLPMVFFGINELSLAKEGELNPYMTGFYERDYLKETLELARELFPDKKSFVALHDDSAAGAADMEIFFNYAGDYPEYSFTDIDTSFYSMDELTQMLTALNDDDILFYMTCYSDKDGNTYSMKSMTNTVVTHTDVPIFRNYVGGEGYGILGGVYMDFEDQTRRAGEIISSILNDGADISSFPLEFNTKSRTAFDYTLLKKYGINTLLMPKETEFYNKEETFGDRYGSILAPMGLIGVALLLLILGADMALRLGKLTNNELLASKESLEDMEKEQRYRAEHDDFLGILNRRAASEYMRNNLTSDDTFAIVMSDIDGFKSINESYGHIIADTLLKKLSASLKELADKNGWLIARYGGDEFMLLISGKRLTEESEAVAEILKTFRTPIQGGNGNISFYSSIGISNSDGISTPEQHILYAETAMYEAKNKGGNRAFIYADEMKEKAREEATIKEKLTEAFENDGFYMLYQPQINSKTKKVSGFEALVRMKEPGLYPGQFIPVAESNGWIWKIGRITTELVIKQLAAWRDAGFTLYPVSVNFSSNQMADTNYISFVEELLRKYDIPAKYLEIEITEGLFLDRTAQAESLFNRFKDMGIRLLMDDFGTGYSSLGYLTYIPVDVIKLDKSLVDTYLVDGKDLFIKDVIQLMHDLDKEMIIEGVEEQWQFERLREFKADVIQGYYFSKPIPPEEAIVFEVKE